MDSGCDVDRAAVAFDGDQWRETPLYCSLKFSTELDEHGLEQSLLCRTHLLQAGADPTIGFVNVSDVNFPISAIEHALTEKVGGVHVTVISRKTLVSQQN